MNLLPTILDKIHHQKQLAIKFPLHTWGGGIPYTQQKEIGQVNLIWVTSVSLTACPIVIHMKLKNNHSIFHHCSLHYS